MRLVVFSSRCEVDVRQGAALKARLLILLPMLALIAVVPGSVYPSQAVLTSPPGTTPLPLWCASAPHKCGLPDSTNTGVQAGVTLAAVPDQVSSGPGWSFDPRGWVEVSGDGAVLSGLYIPYNVDISANNVIINDVRVVTSGDFGISLRHTSGVTIENSTISGRNAAAGRVDAAITDVYGDSAGTVIEADNIFHFRTAVQVSGGLVAGNYIHSPGFIAGDHTNGVYDNGGTAALTIAGNTIINPLEQTDAVTLDASGGGQTVANKIVEGNLLAGGGYAIYGGASEGNATSNIVIAGNWFSQVYYPDGGLYGPAVYFDVTGAGNVWSGNLWSGQGLQGDASPLPPIPPP
jgi:hypothetical protein